MDEKPYHHGDLRAALLSAAEAELTERGIEGFSLRSVAKRAGVSHAAPAHHFGDTNGLLTALAAEGFKRFQATLDTRQTAASNARERAVAAGLGYMEFAVARPALFRLIFSSTRPDFADSDLHRAASAAYDNLVGLVQSLGGTLADVMALWAMSHGLADLTANQRLRSLSDLPAPQRDDILRAVLLRALPGDPTPNP